VVLVDAVRAAATRLAGTSDEDRTALRARIDRLTDREREVLAGVVSGLPNKSIAFDLDISPRTVEVHRANLMAKLDARSLADLVRIALRAGVVAG
jgi:two-component system response regulator FixJ